MCVILVCDRSRPTPEMVKASWERNSHGGGVAWQHEYALSKDDKKAGRTRGRRVVRWRKGLELEEMLQLAKDLPVPFVMHFRIASVGPRIGDLTHPFPLIDGIPLDWEGESEKGVLFHNGHWNRWDETILDAAFKSPRPEVMIPDGAWSDSRGMTWLAHHFGYGVVDLVVKGSRVVIMGPEEDDFHLFGSWERRIAGPYEEGGGILPSNDSWKPRNFRGSHSGSSGQKDHWTQRAPHSMAGGNGGTSAGDSSKERVGAQDVKGEKGEKGEGRPDPPPAAGPSSMVPAASSQSANSSEGGSSQLQVMGPMMPLSAKAARRLRKKAEKTKRREARRMERAIAAGTLIFPTLH